jgi:acyl-coenzyme A synthetase/AMP-(fatty) acid ligase/acyl carrier protein
VEAAVDAGDDTPAGEMRRHQVTHLQCTPSLASMLAGDGASRAALGSLRRMLVGGEALSADLAADLRRCTTGTVLNMYGPTETTVWSSTYAPDGAGPLVPIGRPIANTQLYILDRHRQPVPIGLPGELYIGGDGVTRGYLHRPELTAERFVDDPFTPGNGGGAASAARLYRTGDLVRYRADGVIEFLGRIDHQVKIRGHRIELGEIEAAIRADNGVRDTVVVVREDTPGDQRLVGYVVPHAAPPAGQSAGQRLDLDALKARLKTALPDVMVPSTLVKLDTLPRTPNGKIDRRALPKPESAAAAPRVLTAAAKPEGGVEATIAGIWQDVLHIPVVGLDDNFFDLGGHSLLTVQVLARVREHTGQNIPITDMFRFPTVRLLAAHLSGANKGSAALERGQARADARRNARRRQPPPSS